MELPYLTGDLAGIGGTCRRHVDDFHVEELPLYPASGEGTHVYFRVRKRGLPTHAAVDRIARYMHRPSRDVGVAGLKDAHAVTTQTMSLEHADESKLAAYRDGKVEVLETTRHTNKLRPGHLAGNRFCLRIRDVGAGQLAAARRILDVLVERGVPNFFGPQRFGARQDTADLGRAMVANDLEEFTAILLGRPRSDDPRDCRAAREAFDAGRFDEALRHWPRHYANERRALSAYRKRRRARAAFAAADRRMKRLYASAFQSAMFNEVLVRRLATIDRVLRGDLARKTDTGGVFLVADADAEQPRAERFEISATGPIFGYRSSLAEGEPGEIERGVLADHGLAQEDFRRAASVKLKGTRRALRFALGEPHLTAGTDEHGEFLELSFTAPSGCYATIVLGEIMKTSNYMGVRK